MHAHKEHFQTRHWNLPDSWSATCDPLAVHHCVALTSRCWIWEKRYFMLTRAHLGGIQLKNMFRYRAEMVSRDQYSLPCNHKRHKELRTATPDESIHMLEDFRRLPQGSVMKTRFICLQRDGLLWLFSNRLNVSLSRTPHLQTKNIQVPSDFPQLFPIKSCPSAC